MTIGALGCPVGCLDMSAVIPFHVGDTVTEAIGADCSAVVVAAAVVAIVVVIGSVTLAKLILLRMFAHANKNKGNTSNDYEMIMK